MKCEPIYKLVQKTNQIDPINLKQKTFTYIDISSIDKDTKAITSPQEIKTTEAPSRARKEIRANDVLVSTVRPNLNSVAITPPQYENQIASTGFCILRTKSALLDPYYLFYFTQTNLFITRLIKFSIGASYPAVSDETILETEIPLPPLPEQLRIAAILQKADRIRRLRRYTRKLSDGYLQSVFLEMFEPSLLGKTDTPLVSVDSVCTKITDGTHITPKYIDNGIPFISIKDLTKHPGQIDFSDARHISLEEHKKLSKLTNVEKDDVLYTKVGTYGIAQLVTTDIEFSIFVSIALLKPDKNRILPKFLETVLNTDFVKKQADRLVSGIGVPDLHLREIKTISIPLPNMTQQHRFVEIINKNEHLQIQQSEAERQSNFLFQSLLHQAFQGEL